MQQLIYTNKSLITIYEINNRLTIQFISIIQTYAFYVVDLLFSSCCDYCYWIYSLLFHYCFLLQNTQNYSITFSPITIHYFFNYLLALAWLHLAFSESVLHLLQMIVYNSSSYLKIYQYSIKSYLALQL